MAEVVNDVKAGPKKLPFGAPGIEPRWTHSAKEGIGTAYHTSCRVWFTISHGIVNEIYYPYVDQPNTRDLELLITDGTTFCHEEKRDLVHRVRYPERNALYYQLTNSDPGGRYRIVKWVLADPHSSVFLQHTRIEVDDERLRTKLRVFALLAPHVKRSGKHNNAARCDMAGRKLFNAHRDDVHLSFGCEPDFVKRSVGYVGSSDGWQDVMSHREMRWEFDFAEDGNLALTGEVDLSRGLEFTLGVAFGPNRQSAVAKLLQSFAQPFEAHRTVFVEQWQRAVMADDPFRAHTGDEGHLLRLSRSVLLAHEDKSFQGAIVASMSIPWGETHGDEDLGGYHLVWTRDLVHSATALLATGQMHTPLRALIWLASIQAEDGWLPQNSWIDGRPVWTGKQLDEVAAPVLLAWRLRRESALAGFDPWMLVMRAARCIIIDGPMTQQERWEENAGYSPSTLAWAIAALVCAADFAKARNEQALATVLLEHADWLSDNVERWTVTNRGELVRDKPRHYVRITPCDRNTPDPHVDPDEAVLTLANGSGNWPARNVVGADFLELVRLGIRDPHDPLVRESLEVIDRVLKHELPQGPGWRRYNHDGYGQKDDGSAFDGAGVGRCWPLLTGERGHYELAAGRDSLPFIEAMERFANAGGLLPEQVWDGAPLGDVEPGGATGAAMPLCWAHSEYIQLVRSRRDGVCFSRIQPAYERYVARKTRSAIDVWTLRRPVSRIEAGKRLRLVFAGPVTVEWTSDVATHRGVVEARTISSKLSFADLPTESLEAGARVRFTIRSSEGARSNGHGFEVEVRHGV